MKHLILTLTMISLLNSTTAMAKELIQNVKESHILQHEVPMEPVSIKRYNASSRKKGLLMEALKKAFPSKVDHQQINKLFIKVPTGGLPQIQVLNYNYFRFGPHRMRIFYNKKVIAFNGKEIQLEDIRDFNSYYQKVKAIIPNKRTSYNPFNLVIDEANAALVTWLIVGAVVAAAAGITAWYSSIAKSEASCKGKRNSEFARLSNALNDCKADQLEVQYDVNYWAKSPTKRYIDNLNRSNYLEAKLVNAKGANCVDVHQKDSKYDGIFWSEPQCVERGFIDEICDKIKDVRRCLNGAKELAEKKRQQEEEKRKAKEQVSNKEGKGEKEVPFRMFKHE